MPHLADSLRTVCQYRSAWLGDCGRRGVQRGISPFAGCVRVSLTFNSSFSTWKMAGRFAGIRSAWLGGCGRRECAEGLMPLCRVREGVPHIQFVIFYLENEWTSWPREFFRRLLELPQSYHRGGEHGEEDARQNRHRCHPAGPGPCGDIPPGAARRGDGGRVARAQPHPGHRYQLPGHGRLLRLDGGADRGPPFHIAGTNTSLRPSAAMPSTRRASRGRPRS